MYLTRGKTYRFVNGNSSGAHPFRIQSVAGAGGTEYNTGVTNNSGAGGSTIIFEVPHNAPDVLYYICTSHASMNGIFYVTGALADGSVTTAKLADDAVSTAKIADNAVTLAKLGSGSLPTDITVARANIVAGSVNDSIIDSAAVTSSKIANEAVTLDKLEHGTGSNDGKFLRANNGADPTFETVSSVGGATGVGFNDSVKVQLGTDNDLRIFYNGSDSFIQHHDATTNNDLRIESDTKTIFGSVGGAETHAVFNDDGAVELYHNNAKKLETSTTGATVTGTVAQTVLPSWSLRPNTASDVAGFPHSNMGHTIGWSASTSGASAKACHLSGGCTLGNFTGSPVGSGFQLAGGGTSGKLTVPLAGKYSVWVKIRAENAWSTGYLKMFVNGTQVAAERTIHFNANDSKPHSLGPMVLDLAANDYIEIVVEANIPSGGFSGYNKKYNWFTGHYIG